MITCSICNKEIQKTNQHCCIIDGKSVVLCGKHYSQYMVHRKFFDNSPFSSNDRNRAIINGDEAYIITTDNKGNETGRCTVDADKLDILLPHKWRNRSGYFYTNIPNHNIGKIESVSMHRFLLGLGKERSISVDHIDHDPSNNRMSNLRAITQQQNIINQSIKSCNKTGISGVHREGYRWIAGLKYKYIQYHIGKYSDFNEAVYARFIGELLIFREYRNTNNDKQIKKCISKVSAQRKKEIRTQVYSVLLPLAKTIDQ